MEIILTYILSIGIQYLCFYFYLLVIVYTHRREKFTYHPQFRNLFPFVDYVKCNIYYNYPLKSFSSTSRQAQVVHDSVSVSVSVSVFVFVIVIFVFIFIFMPLECECVPPYVFRNVGPISHRLFCRIDVCRHTNDFMR